MFEKTADIALYSIDGHTSCFLKVFAISNTPWQSRDDHCKPAFWFRLKYQIVMQMFVHNKFILTLPLQIVNCVD